MLERISTLLRPRSAPVFVFLVVFVVVFLLVVVTSTFITFILPEAYSSTARILLRQDATPATRETESKALAGSYDPYYIQTQFGIIESEVVLGKVIEDLDLNKAWGLKYANGERLRASETLALLKTRIDLHPVRNTWLIELRVFSDQPAEAAMLANAIAVSYREWCQAHGTPVEIVDKAVPGLRPVRPNKPLNIALGVAGGLLLASAAGAGIAGLAAWIGRKARGNGVPPGTGAAPPPIHTPAGSRPAKSGVDKITGLLWMGIGGLLFGVALLFLLWFLTLHQTDVTAELLALPLFGLIWGVQRSPGLLPFPGKALGEDLPRRGGRSAPDVLLLQIRASFSPRPCLGLQGNHLPRLAHGRAAAVDSPLGVHCPRARQRLCPIVASQSSRHRRVLRDGMVNHSS